MRFLVAVPAFFADVVAQLRDEAHESRPTTYQVMRRLYVVTHGRSRRAWIALFALFRRRRATQDPLGLADEVGRRGFAVRPSWLPADQVAAIRSHLERCPGTVVGRDTRRCADITEVGDGIRFDHDTADVLAAPGVLDLLAHPDLLGAAGRYLGSEPVLAGINCWWSLHAEGAEEADYSVAAQMFHFDADWPAFVKFFVYLVDVGDDDGPFSIIEGTHRHKPVWRDGRFTESELLDGHGLRDRERRLTGPAGTLVAADTAALHRGSPVVSGPRLVLEVEFAVSRLGAAYQYELLPASLRPRAGGPHTYALFSAPDAPPTTGAVQP